MKLPGLVSSLIIAALIGAAGLVVDRRAAARETAANTAFPPQGQLLQVGDHTVHVYVTGSGPDLVLLHGASGNLRDFTFSLAAKLAADYRVIAFDRPGLAWTAPLPGGDTSLDRQATLLRQAAAQIGVRNPVVLGHSYGGAVAMAWALQAPDDTAALVLVSAATMPWEGSIWWLHNVMGNTLGGHTVVPLVTAFAGNQTAEDATRSIFAPDPMPDGYLAHIGADLTMRRASLRANSGQVAGLKPHVIAMSEGYANLDIPVELIHGDADTIVPLNVHARRLVNVLPNATLTILPGTGHMPHHSNEGDVIAAIHRAASRAGLR
jgi:pimeloyl-ACP methyl ester carboxylesterase